MWHRAHPEHLDAWRSLLEVHAVVLAVLEDEMRREHGLSLAEYEVLLCLAQAPGRRMRMQELARDLLITQSGVTRLVERMERAGLVARRPAEDDGRGTLATITEAGLRKFRRAAPTHLRGIREHFLRPLSPGEVGVIGEAMRKVLAARGPRAPRTGRRTVPAPADRG